MSVASEQVFHVGDRAWLVSEGPEPRIEVEVIEERGPIGVGGRHLVRVRERLGSAEPFEYTVAEADLRPITGAA